MDFFLRFLLIFIIVLYDKPSLQQPTDKYKKYKLVRSDEFNNDGAPDSTKKRSGIR